MKVVKIGAVWCSSCIIMGLRWQEIEKENPWLKTQYLDFDLDENKVKKYNLDGQKLPAVIFLDKKGKEFLRQYGELSKQKLIEIIKRYKNK